MKKYSIVVVFYLCFLNSFSANEKNICVDTAFVIFKKYTDYNKQTLARNFLDSHYLNDTLYYYKNKEIKKRAQPMGKAYGATFDVCRGKSYFFFYTKRGKLIAEGNWHIEGFVGSYKEYYKNGNPKLDGFYSGDLKIKLWKYYNESGKLIKEEEYDEKGNLLPSKKQ